MAKSLHKKTRLTIRFTEKQIEDLAKAAKKVSVERGELIEESTLGRELINKGVAEIVGAAA